MTSDRMERTTAEGLHEIADIPGEDTYFVDISPHDLSVWVCGVCPSSPHDLSVWVCGVCPSDDCDWTGELGTEDSEALSELVTHLHDEHGVFARMATEEVA